MTTTGDLARQAPVCRNCGQPLTGRFCSACGQEDRPLGVTLGDVVGETWGALTNLEGRVAQSFAKLFAAPGFLTREYLEGRRVRWMSPVRLYLIVSVMYFGLTSLTGWGGMDFDIAVRGEDDLATQEELRSLGFESQAELDEAATDAVATWLPRAMFLLVPLFAALVAAARRVPGMTYPQHVVFSLHLHAAVFGAFALSTLVSGPIGGETFDALVGGITIGYSLVYLVLAMRAVYGGSLRRAIVIGGMLSATYWLLAIAVTVAILMPLVLTSGR